MYHKVQTGCHIEIMFNAQKTMGTQFHRLSIFHLLNLSFLIVELIFDSNREYKCESGIAVLCRTLFSTTKKNESALLNI